jgi:hypothetical protein
MRLSHPVLALAFFGLALGAFNAFADEPEENLADLPLADKRLLLEKVARYKGKIKGAPASTVRSTVLQLAHDKEELSAASFKCSMLNPTLDNGQKEHFLDCEVRSFRKAGLLELNFGTHDWEPKLAKISDVTYDFDRNVSREGKFEIVKRAACLKEHGKPAPAKTHCLCSGGRYDGLVTECKDTDAPPADDNGYGNEGDEGGGSSAQ